MKRYKIFVNTETRKFFSAYLIHVADVTAKNKEQAIADFKRTFRYNQEPENVELCRGREEDAYAFMRTARAEVA